MTISESHPLLRLALELAAAATLIHGAALGCLSLVPAPVLQPAAHPEQWGWRRDARVTVDGCETFPLPAGDPRQGKYRILICQVQASYTGNSHCLMSAFVQLRARDGRIYTEDEGLFQPPPGDQREMLQYQRDVFGVGDNGVYYLVPRRLSPALTGVGAVAFLLDRDAVPEEIGVYVPPGPLGCRLAPGEAVMGEQLHCETLFAH